MLAAGGGHLDIVTLMCSSAAAGTAGSLAWEDGLGPLEAAAEGGHAAVVAYLLREGYGAPRRAESTSTSYSTRAGPLRTDLHRAGGEGPRPCGRDTPRGRFDANAMGGARDKGFSFVRGRELATPAQEAAAAGAEGALAVLLRHVADGDRGDLLLKAASNGRLSTVRWLMAAGAPVHRGQWGWQMGIRACASRPRLATPMSWPSSSPASRNP